MKLLLLLLSFAVLSAQPHARPPAAAQTHKRDTAAQPRATDAEIQARIQAKLAKSKIGKNGFKFTTSGGVTTIEGKANVIQHKGAATRLAKTAGARSVNNKIEISEEAKEAARARLASGRRRVQVKRSEVRSQQR
ncbi:MAG TPA: BON domain-containing protein [Bryobacteraceae bacterium]|nr:BON domain-containing protein [Bryobacteraceae bacterium]